MDEFSREGCSKEEERGGKSSGWDWHDEPNGIGRTQRYWAGHSVEQTPDARWDLPQLKTCLQQKRRQRGEMQESDELEGADEAP